MRKLMWMAVIGALAAMLFCGTSPAETIAGGSCGTHVTWALSDDGTLTISGSGAMQDYTYEIYDDHPYYPWPSSITSVVIEPCVTRIGKYAFMNCRSLASVTIPDSVTRIGFEAFSGCADLPAVSIPDSVVRIDRGAFHNCVSLTSIVIPDGVTDISYSAFQNCPNLASVTIPDSVTGIGNYAFLGCSALTSLRLPDSVTSIGNYAFQNCTHLADFTIPDSVTVIGSSAFQNCFALTNITVPNGIAAIGNGTFRGCTGLRSVTIPDTVTLIGNYAFYGCTRLENIAIPDSVTGIGSYAFSKCTGLTGITIPDGVSSIGTNAFDGCTRLACITTPSCNTYAYRWARENGSWQVIALIHPNIVRDEAVAAACTENGLTEGSHCSVCGEILMPQETVPAVGHTVAVDEAVMPTDTRPGLSEGSHCEVCGAVLAAQELLHPLVWEIEASSDGVTILRRYGSDPLCVIPDTLESMPVRAVAAGAFPTDSCPACVYIPAGIREISPEAFAHSVTVYCLEYSEADYWADDVGYDKVYVNNASGGTFYIILMPDPFTMQVGETRELGASVWPFAGGDTITVTSSDPAVVSADGQTLTALAVGQATVTLRVGGLAETVTVTVRADPTDFTITDTQGRTGEIRLITKETCRLVIADVTPAGAVTEVSWSSSSTANATVTADGLVTARRAGSAVVTATMQNGLSRSIGIIVTLPTVTGISFADESLSVGSGCSAQLIAAVTMIDGQVYENRFVTFTSSDDAIASVDPETGLITGVGPGTATITATAVSDGAVTASCTVTVLDAHILSLPADLTVIGSQAFADLPDVDAVLIPAGVTAIADDAFAGSDIVILCQAGSYAAEWAEAHGFCWQEP